MTVALLAALAVLFVSTASMACETAVDQDMASMAMTADGDPCGSEAARVVCQKACLVFCQGLVSQDVVSAPARVHASVRYPSLDPRHADFNVESDDPPPRA